MSEGFKERVINERGELAERIAKLTAFIDGETFQTLDESERTRLRSQRYHMSGYLSVLTQRIDAMR